ncbi:MAG: N-acetylmuramoyl-L-alanine amidase family protein [Bacillota bacterium]
MIIILQKNKSKYFFFLLLSLILAFVLVGQRSPFFYDWVLAVNAKGGPLIVIDAGHGGRDPGAVAGGVLEKNINLEVAKKLQKILQSRGFRVVMTRNGDENLANWRDNGSFQRASLWQRAKISNTKKAFLLVSIHCNSDGNKTYHGAQTFYHPGSAQGQKAAASIQEELIKVRYTRRKAIPGDYYLLRNTNCTTVIVELGYLSNPGDFKFLNTTDSRNQYAQAIANGIAKVY